MSVETITPRMQQALRNNAQLLFFGDLWLSTLASTIDTQADWQTSALIENIDLDTEPGEVRLEKDPDYATPVISQATGASTQSLYRDIDLDEYDEETAFTSVWQRFVPNDGGDFNNIVFKVTNPSSSERTVHVRIYQHNPDVDDTYTQPGRLYNKHIYYHYLGTGSIFGYSTVIWQDTQHYHIASQSATIAGSYTGEVTVDFSGHGFLAGMTYWLVLYADVAVSNTPSIYYNPSDVYAGGQCYTVTETRHKDSLPRIYKTEEYVQYYTHTYTDIGDAYFKVQVDGYKPSGSLTSARIDLGAVPPEVGNFQLAAQTPLGTSLGVTLNAYTNEDDTTPAWTLADIEDGQEIPAYRYWDIIFTLASDSLYAYTPKIDMAEILFPETRMLLRPADTPLIHAGADILRDYQPLLAPPEMRTSELKIMDRVASGGSATITLEEPTPDTLLRIAADRPIKNFRLSLYVGADVPGFAATDLCRYFIGIVDKVTIQPRYRGQKYRLILSAKNPVLELKRKAPLKSSSAESIDLAAIAINHDGTHVADSMYDIIRNHAAIPARYVNTISFRAAKTSCGYGSLAAGALVVYRSASGTYDTRIKSPQEISKHLAPLATIIDGYIVEDESSRLKLVLHDPDAAAEAAWADESLVRAGYDAVPIESVESINLGYDDLLANVVYCGCEWNGSGSDWTAFGNVTAAVNANSTADYTMSTTQYLSAMEKNMREVSQWLGPEAKYNGETISRELAQLLANRFGYPPARIIGAVLPVSQFMRTLGSVVTVYSEEYARYKRRGIAESEAVKFMVIKKQYDRGRNKMVFDLVELI